MIKEKWEEVSMTKALKLWVNNGKYIKWIDDDGFTIKITGRLRFTLESYMMRSGKWYVYKGYDE